MLQHTTMEIMQDNKTHLERFHNNPPHSSYIAGFIDGDGCIFIRKIKGGYQTGFTITQSRTNVLQIIRYHFGGSITTSSNRNNKVENIMDNDGYYFKHNIRNQYNLIVRNNEYKLLLEYLQESFIIKEHRYQCLHEFNKIANITNKNVEKEQIYSKYSECNTNIELYYNRLNIEYIAGLFDAEGCIYINKNKTTQFYISITQSSHPEILCEIVKYLGFGTIDSESKLKIYKKEDCIRFIQLIKPHLIVKYNQSCAIETFLETTDPIIKEQMYAICNREKHEIEIFTDVNQNSEGKERFSEKMHLKSIMEQICREIHNNQIYKDKSEKMKGTGNHNYGKTFSTETKKKMSESIRVAKGGVTDEMIEKVRKMITDGYRNIDIQTLLVLPRHTVTRIKNREIVCRNEEKRKR